MLLHAITVFLSAALLFQVQLLMGSQLLPWFGGGAGVWTACLAFFQVALLLGYLLAHLLGRWTVRRQAFAHVALAALSIALLPITPGPGWKPEPGGEPVLDVLAILAVHAGLPCVVLAASTVLLQHWLEVERPWILYAASNCGALLGLLSYPFVLEPELTRGQRAELWTGAYLLFVALLAACAAMRWRAGNERAVPDAAEPAEEGAATRVLWVLLPGCSSALMLAITRELSLRVPPTPFLWVLPLSIHLATFAIAFTGERVYPRRIAAAAGILALWPAINALYSSSVDSWVRLVDSFAGRVAALSALLFCACLLCHGELYRARPRRGRLSAFYLSIAFGGAVGGSAVALGAPLWFDSAVELNVALVASTLVLVGGFARGSWHRRHARWATGAAVLLCGALAWRLEDLERRLRAGAIDQRRNLYGHLVVYELDRGDLEWHRLALVSGTIEHGHQLQNLEWKRRPSTYFTPSSGVGLALAWRPHQKRNIGVIGLGIGTLAAWARAGDRLRFYEIDPNVIALAGERFDYLANCPAEVEIVPGDARLSLEREAPQGFDLLVADAFSAGVPPVHLLTRECFELYLSHLAPGGILALNVTSHTLDFRPVLAAVARALDLGAVLVSSPQGIDGKGSHSRWVLMTRDRAFLEDPRVLARSQPLGEAGERVWTDDRAPLLELIDWD